MQNWEFHPKTKVPSQDPVQVSLLWVLPSPSSGDLNANKAVALGAWQNQA